MADKYWSSKTDYGKDELFVNVEGQRSAYYVLTADASAGQVLERDNTNQKVLALAAGDAFGILEHDGKAGDRVRVRIRGEVIESKLIGLKGNAAAGAATTIAVWKNTQALQDKGIFMATLAKDYTQASI
jgi:hypothetical protein